MLPSHGLSPQYRTPMHVVDRAVPHADSRTTPLQAVGSSAKAHVCMSNVDFAHSVQEHTWTLTTMRGKEAATRGSVSPAVGTEREYERASSCEQATMRLTVPHTGQAGVRTGCAATVLAYRAAAALSVLCYAGVSVVLLICSTSCERSSVSVADEARDIQPRSDERPKQRHTLTHYHSTAALTVRYGTSTTISTTRTPSAAASRVPLLPSTTRSTRLPLQQNLYHFVAHIIRCC